MASLVDSVKTILDDSHPFFKITSLSLIMFFVFQLDSVNYLADIFNVIVKILAFLVIFGYALVYVHNNLNEKNILLPNLFNPFNLILRGVQGLVALLPVTVVVYLVMHWVRSMLSFAPMLNYVIFALIFSILFSFFVVSMLFYCKAFNTAVAYNLKNLYKYSGDFIIYNFVLLITIVILVAVVFLPIGYAVKMMFDYGAVFDFYIVFAATFISICILQYYCQMYFEFIDLSGT